MKFEKVKDKLILSHWHNDKCGKHHHDDEDDSVSPTRTLTIRGQFHETSDQDRRTTINNTLNNTNLLLKESEQAPSNKSI
jgi:hypothetical protein